MKKINAKLSLHRETIKQLSTSALEDAIGAAMPTAPIGQCTISNTLQCQSIFNLCVTQLTCACV